MRISWLMLVALAGCASPPGGLDSPVPVERLDAIAKVARDNDRAAIPKLITFLNSDDPIVRLASIRTLESLTGQTLGYDHAAPEWQRRDMVRAWVEWHERGQPAPDPQQNPPSTPSNPDNRPGATARPGPENADTVC